MQILLGMALAMQNVPYKWGGNNPLEGFDCSGFVQYVLKHNGAPLTQDYTAQGLFDHYSKNGSWNVCKPGALVFYGKDSKSITHVALCLDQYRVIECGGGDHLTLTKEDAVSKGACVKIQPIKYRPDFIAIIRPDYSFIGIY